MPEENNFKSVEKTLKKSQELMDKVLKQNEKWHGSGAFEEDIISARKLLVEMEQTLSDIVAAFSQGSFRHLRNQDIKTEVGHAYNKACSLMSHLYDDIRRVHDALPKGQSQSDAIKQTGIHLQRITQHCHQVQNHFLEVVRMMRTERRRDA